MTDSVPARIRPLERRDPPMLGPVMIQGRLASSDAGVVYAGQLVDRQVAVVTLTDGAETDSFGRARFAQAVHDVIEDGSAEVLAADGAEDVSPWVAFAAAGAWDEVLAVARRVLAPVTLADLPSVGEVRGPDFRPHWYRLSGVGRWRLWPLPWPSALSAAGRWTFIAAFGLMLAIAALALWIATVVFRNAPLPPPPPQRVTRTVPSPPPVTLRAPSTPIPSTGGSGRPASAGPSGPEPSIM